MLFLIPIVVLFGSRWGPVGMAWAMACLMVVLFIPSWAALVNPICGAGLGEYFTALALPTFCAVIAGIIGWICTTKIDSVFVKLALGGLVGSLSYTGLSLVFNRDGMLRIIGGGNLGSIGSRAMK